MSHRIPARQAFLAVLLLITSLSASAFADEFCNVRTFGAVGDGKHLDSPAINSAIETTASSGGGTVIVPAGTYLCGSIHLKSNIHLIIDAGATILGAPQELNVYDETEPWPYNPYQDGGHCYFHNSLIWGENLTNVSITGRGEINGGGMVWQDKILDKMCGYTYWQTGTAAPAGQVLPPLRLGNKSIALKLCRNVLIRDVTIFHGGHFGILVTGCDDLTIDNVTIDTNRDGMDIDCCRNTVVSNCRVNSFHDDAIVPKSSYALGYNQFTENLTITNCQVSGFEEGTLLDGSMKPSKLRVGRIKFGTESSGGFRNCTISNCTFRSCRGFALEEVDGGTLEDFTVTNLTMVDVYSYAIYITTGTRNRGGDAEHESILRNVVISNVIADHVNPAGAIQITGEPGHPIENLRLDNIRVLSDGSGTAKDAATVPPELGKAYPEPKGTMPAYAIFARHVSGLELANISTSFYNTDARPAVAFSDINGLELDNVKPQVADGVPAATFAKDVLGLTIRDSPLIKQGN
jgi:polygalacturonase